MGSLEQYTLRCLDLGELWTPQLIFTEDLMDHSS